MVCNPDEEIEKDRGGGDRDRVRCGLAFRLCRFQHSAVKIAWKYYRDANRIKLDDWVIIPVVSWIQTMRDLLVYLLPGP